MEDENLLENEESGNELYVGSEKSLRPTGFEEYIGQPRAIKQLKVHVGAVKARQAKGEEEVLEHVMFEGQAGLGKTSLAFVVANELGSKLRVMQAKSLEKAGDLVANISCLEHGDVLFLDEIHSLDPSVAEILYSVMEDFRLDITADGRVLNIPLPHFTLIGATTDFGKLKKPLQERFTHKVTLLRYTDSELIEIIERSAPILGYEIERDAAELIAKRAKGTPRTANSILKIARNYAELNGGVITVPVTKEALEDADISEDGLRTNDVRYLTCLFESGKPIGLTTLSGMTGIDIKTVETTVEPYLLENGFIEKLPRGRCLTKRGVEYVENLQSDVV